jgi:hypothetical protein
MTEYPHKNNSTFEWPSVIPLDGQANDMPSPGSFFAILTSHGWRRLADAGAAFTFMAKSEAFIRGRKSQL